MPKPLLWKFARPTPDEKHRLLTEYCIDLLSQIVSNVGAPASMRREAADMRRRFRSSSPYIAPGDITLCDIMGWAIRRPQTDYWRRSSLLIIIDHADADNEEVKTRAKKKELAEHVARHPKDGGRTIEDFKWMVWERVCVNLDGQEPGGEFGDTEDADGPSETLH